MHALLQNLHYLDASDPAHLANLRAEMVKATKAWEAAATAAHAADARMRELKMNRSAAEAAITRLDHAIAQAAPGQQLAEKEADRLNLESARAAKAAFESSLAASK